MYSKNSICLCHHKSAILSFELCVDFSATEINCDQANMLSPKSGLPSSQKVYIGTVEVHAILLAVTLLKRPGILGTQQILIQSIYCSIAVVLLEITLSAQ